MKIDAAALDRAEDQARENLRRRREELRPLRRFWVFDLLAGKAVCLYQPRTMYTKFLVSDIRTSIATLRAIARVKGARVRTQEVP